MPTPAAGQMTADQMTPELFKNAVLLYTCLGFDANWIAGYLDASRARVERNRRYLRESSNLPTAVLSNLEKGAIIIPEKGTLDGLPGEQLAFIYEAVGNLRERPIGYATLCHLVGFIRNFPDGAEEHWPGRKKGLSVPVQELRNRTGLQDLNTWITALFLAGQLQMARLEDEAYDPANLPSMLQLMALDWSTSNIAGFYGWPEKVIKADFTAACRDATSRGNSGNPMQAVLKGVYDGKLAYADAPPFKHERVEDCFKEIRGAVTTLTSLGPDPEIVDFWIELVRNNHLYSRCMRKAPDSTGIMAKLSAITGITRVGRNLTALALAGHITWPMVRDLPRSEPTIKFLTQEPNGPTHTGPQTIKPSRRSQAPVVRTTSPPARPSAAATAMAEMVKPTLAPKAKGAEQNTTRNPLAITINRLLAEIGDPSKLSQRESLLPRELGIILERQFIEVVSLLREGDIPQPRQNSDVELWARPQKLRAEAKRFLISLLRGEEVDEADEAIKSTKNALHAATNHEGAFIAAWTGLLGDLSGI